MKEIIKEFQKFIARGNVIDLAVGVIIGAAFGKIVNSLVQDIIMPPIGFILAGVDFKDIKIILQKETIESGFTVSPEISINIGNFVQVMLDFLIVAICIFFVVKLINQFKEKLSKQEQKIEKTKKSELQILEEIKELLIKNYENKPIKK